MSKHDIKWMEHAVRARAFWGKHGRLPRQGEDGYVWLANVRTASRGTGRMRWTQERQDWLDQNLPNWRGGHSKNMSWQKSADKALEFLKKNGRLPYFREGTAGHWIATQRMIAKKGSKTWTQERQDWMDQNLPGWQVVPAGRKPDDGLWLSHAQRAIEALQLADDDISDAARASRSRFKRWLSAQRRSARLAAEGRSGELAWGPTRRVWMDEHVPGWLDQPR